MKETTVRLERLLDLGKEYLSKAPESELNFKPRPEKWSKKEILGHLIDSGVNNLQRFTEIQFENKPYEVLKYNQDELVKSNDYQHADINEIVAFWLALNNRVIHVMNHQTPSTLDYKIVPGDTEITNLKLLMIDYVDHNEYHLKQIMGVS